SLSWSLAVELTPRSRRPYIGGSRNNSALDLALGYNGLGRIFGGAGNPAGGGPPMGMGPRGGAAQKEQAKTKGVRPSAPDGPDDDALPPFPPDGADGFGPPPGMDGPGGRFAGGP